MEKKNSFGLAKIRWNKQVETYGKTTVLRVSAVNGVAKFAGHLNGEEVVAIAEGATNKEALDNLWKKILK